MCICMLCYFVCVCPSVYGCDPSNYPSDKIQNGIHHKRAHSSGDGIEGGVGGWGGGFRDI